MSKILVLPGTKWQIPLIQKIKSLGHDTFIVNPIPHSGVYELADYFLPSDIFAIDAIEKYAREEQIDAVISDECDIAIPVVAELGRRLNVPTLSSEAATLYHNKYLMRTFGKENGIATVDYRLCDNINDTIEFLHCIGKPIIIKPIDSSSSRGVFTIESEKDIIKHFDETLSFSRSQKAVLAERYITGTEFTVDGVKTPDHHYTLAISEKKHYSHNENIANELFFTHSNDRYDYDQLKRTNDLFVMNSPLEFGLTHAEYKYENGEFYLIEIGARGGGNLISAIITQHMSGYEPYEYLIHCSLGNITEQSFDIPESYLNRAAVLKFFDVPHGGGKVKEIIGVDYLQSEPDIVDYGLNFSKGEQIKNAENDSARIGYYIACSENKEKLKSVMKRVEERFRILVE